MMQVVYHKDYEASKGTMISVAEDPEMMRMRQVTNVISQASYTDHGRDVDSGSNCAACYHLPDTGLLLVLVRNILSPSYLAADVFS